MRHLFVSPLPLAALLATQLLACKDRAQPPAEDLSEATCDGEPALVPRQIRLLTRREYDRTVADLLPQLTGGGSCAVDTDCDFEIESCVVGTCQSDPCELVTFVYPWGGESAVAVAGSFNGWSASAWPLSASPERGVWILKQAIPDGEHQYKFVLNGATWVQDPSNPATVNDGYGGVNSLLVQSCATGGESLPNDPIASPSASFPVESQPTGYPFDNAAETGIVTSVHAQLYGEAAADLAAAATVDLGALLGCPTPSDSCIDPWVARFGRRAFRRTLTADEIARYTALVRSQPDLATGVSAALQAMLQSPWFLYRTEVGVPSGSGYTLEGHGIASAISYFLLSTPPDDELLSKGEAGELLSSGERAAHARRLLASPRARETIEAFAVQWLDVSHVPTLNRIDPTFDVALGQSMVEETAHVVGSTVFEGDGRFTTLLLSDVSWIDARLAALYGLSAPTSGSFEQMSLPPERRGLLGHASILTNTGHADQSSPILRGLFVRERLLCETLPIPPANIGPVPEISEDATTRDRFAQHTADPFCASCHDRIDPVGFGLEAFDEIGRYRTEENGLPIDTTGMLSPEETFADHLELSALLAASSDARRCFATQMWRFSTGRLDGVGQQCELTAIDRLFAESEGDIIELLVQIVSRPDFIARGEP